MHNSQTGQTETFVSAQQIEQLNALNKLHNSLVGGVGNFSDVVHIVSPDDKRIENLIGTWSDMTFSIQANGHVSHHKSF